MSTQTAPQQWQIEMSVSPEWFALQDSSLDLPPATAPQRILLTDDYALIGRESASRDVHPIINADSDAGCSRRHADLTLENGQWVLRDLESVNGTHLQRVGVEFPPEQVTEPTPIEPGDAVFIGAWTKIVLLPAN